MLRKKQKISKKDNLIRQFTFNLGTEATQSQEDFAHRMASASASSIDIPQTRKRDPEDEHEPKGQRGRPRNNQDLFSTPPQFSNTKPTRFIKKDLTKTIKDPPKETKELKRLRLAYEEASNNAYNKKNTPESKAEPEPETVSKAEPKPKAAPKAEPKAKPKPKASPKAEPKAKPKAEPKPKAKPEPPPPVIPIKQVGVTIIENKSKSFWNGQNISVLKEQAQLRGHKFTDVEIKGGSFKVKNKQVKTKRFNRSDYLRVLLGI